MVVTDRVVVTHRFHCSSWRSFELGIRESRIAVPRDNYMNTMNIGYTKHAKYIRHWKLELHILNITIILLQVPYLHNNWFSCHTITQNMQLTHLIHTNARNLSVKINDSIPWYYFIIYIQDWHFPTYGSESMLDSIRDVNRIFGTKQRLLANR